MAQTKKYTALLILGPTGSGKTPLGEYLQAHGLRGKRCFHFDFGNALRRAGRKEAVPPELSEADITCICKVLQQGALLENETFYIAKSLLGHFISGNTVTDKDIIILNGLPRHDGQARDIASIVTIRAVVCLDCSGNAAKRRILLNTGGDRSGRTDDTVEEIERKYRLFDKRTAPLIQYYQEKKIPVHRITIEENTKEFDIVRVLEGHRFV